MEAALENRIVECDVLVIGTGASGMSAAVTAASQGLNVMVVEKEPMFGGTTARSGGWLWIPRTHLAIEQGIEEDPTAALTYLQKLHGMFGTWDLALAAYNAGEGTVQRAINKNRSKGLPTDYESLNLPPETRNYVPKLQAIKNIVTHPERFGLKINSIPTCKASICDLNNGLLFIDVRLSIPRNA